MSGFQVDVEQLRAHAGHVDEVRDRFGAVKSASGHISGDGRAYGALCEWIAGVLESRHKRQDELVAYVEENLRLVAQELRKTADHYAQTDDDNSGLIGKVGGR